ncbi:PAS domain-containing protein [Pontibacter sp. E15-1]|uniref:PAS domain-containing protein n=1 Tax=Pontibacter sp. E15-1 TaxID=2919918 RepID=UPI001F4F5084|nr:PAS domain-containing protein [Pontibacter sp. E15-1]MCJ8166290.1 PAS domain-containing protein [Pontibacter sp. E15-1]
MKYFEETKELLDDSNFYYIIQTNMEGKYEYVNERYRKVFGHIHGPIVGQPYEITMHPDDTRVCQEIAAKCFAYPGKVFPATIRKHDGQGGYIITQWEYKALIDPAGQPAGVFCLGYDVTEYQAHFKQLKDTQTQLAHKDGLLREIAYTQSHVIRKPLANILGLASVLSNMDIDQNMRNICSMLIESCSQLDDVIKATAAKNYDY